MQGLVSPVYSGHLSKYLSGRPITTSEQCIRGPGRECTWARRTGTLELAGQSRNPKDSTELGALDQGQVMQIGHFHNLPWHLHPET